MSDREALLQRVIRHCEARIRRQALNTLMLQIAGEHLRAKLVRAHRTADEIRDLADAALKGPPQ